MRVRSSIPVTQVLVKTVDMDFAHVNLHMLKMRTREIDPILGNREFHHWKTSVSGFS